MRAGAVNLKTWAAGFACCVALASCAQQSSLPPDTSAQDALAARPTIAPVGSVLLITEGQFDELGRTLDIGITPFTTREDAASARGFGA